MTLLCAAAMAFTLAPEWAADNPTPGIVAAAAESAGTAPPAPPGPTGTAPAYPVGGTLPCIIGLNCGCIRGRTCPAPDRRPGPDSGTIPRTTSPPIR